MAKSVIKGPIFHQFSQGAKTCRALNPSPPPDLLVYFAFCANHGATAKTAHTIHSLCMSLTWGAVYVLQVIQGSSSAHVPQSNPHKYHLEVPQLPQGDLCTVPIIALMPTSVPHFCQVVLGLQRGGSTDSATSQCDFKYTIKHNPEHRSGAFQKSEGP